MKSLIPHTLSHFSIVSFLLTGILIFIVLKALRLLLPKMIGKPLKDSAVQPYYSTFEFIVWMSYLIYFSYYFAVKNLFYAGIYYLIIVAVVVWFGWYALRDVVAGFFVRNNKAVYPGSKIIWNDKTVIINNLNGTNIEGLLPNGHLIYIPYSQLIGQSFEHIPEDDDLFSKTIKLKLKDLSDHANREESIRKMLLSHPYYAMSHPPVIQITDKGDREEAKITFYTLDKQKLNELELELRREFE